MLQVEQVRHGIKFRIVWYAEEPIKEKGIISYRHAQFQQKNKQQVGTTLISDLTLPEEEIFQKYSKNCRYYVNRAPREGVICHMYSKEEVTKQEIEDFLQFFVEFWQSKGVDFDLGNQESLRNELNLYREANALCISHAVLNEKIVVYHTYVTDGIYARLLHSASLYRTDDTANANVVGMANRYLHKQDMLALKATGCKFYDWGGAGKTEEVKHITEFKESFGGEPKHYYQFDAVKGFLPRLFLIVVKILRR